LRSRFTRRRARSETLACDDVLKVADVGAYDFSMA
jgi:hypothetical protein